MSKYRAVINFRAEIYPVGKSGECTGQLVGQEELAKKKLKSAMLFALDGDNLTEVIKKLEEVVNYVQAK